MSQWSQTWSFTTVSTIAAAPLLSSPGDGAANITTSPTFWWNASTGATSYRLQVSTSSTFSATAFDQSNLAGTSKSITGLAYSTKYFWRVDAVNGAGASPWSQTRSFTTIARTKHSRLRVSPRLLDFGDVTVKQNRSEPLVITNDGDDTLRITDLTSPNSLFRASFIGFDLAPGDSLIDSIHATAPATAGQINTIALITSNSETGVNLVHLQLNVVPHVRGRNAGGTSNVYFGAKLPEPL